MLNQPKIDMTNVQVAGSPTIAGAIDQHIANVRLARSKHTANTYRNALRAFEIVLKNNGLDPETTRVSGLHEEAVGWLATYLKQYSPGTEQIYLQAAAGFFEYLAADRLTDVNLPRMRLLIRQRGRRPGIRLPQFPVDEIEKILKVASGPGAFKSRKERDNLIGLRDRALLITLADTGLRIHEAANLRRGDIDWNEGKAVIIGKGNKQAVIRFTERAMNALRTYLDARSRLDGATGRPLASLPIFARHDKAVGKKVLAITTTTGRNIVAERVREILGDDAHGRITPHSFRHYFVTTILRGSGNLKMAQELARHSNIQVTQRYAHLSDEELDQGYHDVFERGAQE